MTTLDICLLQWTTNNKRIQKVFASMESQNFDRPIVTGGNSPSWILGHLVDTDDALLEILGVGPRLYPDLAKIYHEDPSTNQNGHLDSEELQKRWQAILARMKEGTKGWTDADWLSRHTLVSEEDFRKEPHRNKLNVMLSRVTHKASHLGQIAMMK
jgi:uncharacterized damage-inducible protein DinB